MTHTSAIPTDTSNIILFMETPNENIKFILKVMQTNRVYRGWRIKRRTKLIAWLFVILLGVSFWGGLLYYYGK